MGLQATSRAAAVGASVNNVVFQASAQNVPHKIAIIGTYDPAKTITDEVPQLITSEADAGNRYGFGSMLHRLVKQTEVGSQGVEMWAIPQTETGAAATGDIAWSGTATEAGTIYCYISGILVTAEVANGDAAATVAAALTAAVTAKTELPVSAVTNVAATEFTAKSKGDHWGNNISIKLNLGNDQELPAGITGVITAMSGGSGTPTILNALNGMGTGDNQNEKNLTELVHGYGDDATTVLDIISAYNGTGNLYEGNYAKLVSRPFRSLVGDVTNTLSTLVTAANLRKLDRTNGMLAVPLSPNHPSEISAIALGIMARINNDRAAQSYIGQTLTGVIATDGSAAPWTDLYDSRDTAVKAGISPTLRQDGVVKLQDVLTYYHPDSVPLTSNGYRSQRNVSILQNVLFNVRQTFSGEKWQGISIVADVAKVSSTIDRQKARDIDAVIDDLVVLATSFEGKAWIYTAAFTTDRLAGGGYVTIRAGGAGFDATLPILLSGEGGIIDTVVEFDTSLAVLLGG